MKSPQEGLLFQRLGEWQERLRRCQQIEEALAVRPGHLWEDVRKTRPGKPLHNYGKIHHFFMGKITN